MPLACGCVLVLGLSSLMNASVIQIKPPPRKGLKPPTPIADHTVAPVQPTPAWIEAKPPPPPPEIPPPPPGAALSFSPSLVEFHGRGMSFHGLMFDFLCMGRSGGGGVPGVAARGSRGPC